MFERLRHAARLARRLGMNHMDEDTKCAVTASCFPDCPDVDVSAFGGDLGYDALQKFKEHFAAAPVVVPGRLPAIYPPFAEFQANFQELFASAGYELGVNESKVKPCDVNKVYHISSIMPRRNTRGTVTTRFVSKSMLASRGNSRAAILNRSMSNIFDEPINVPGFKWCAPQARKGLAVPGQDQQSVDAPLQETPPLQQQSPDSQIQDRPPLSSKRSLRQYKIDQCSCKTSLGDWRIKIP